MWAALALVLAVLAASATTPAGTITAKVGAIYFGDCESPFPAAQPPHTPQFTWLTLTTGGLVTWWPGGMVVWW